MGFLSNFISSVSNTASNLIGGVISSATNSLGGLASQTIQAATPVISTAVNSTAAQIAASGLSGAGATSAQIVAANNQGALYNNTIVNESGRIVRLDKLTGLAKFFCYYKMDSEGRIELDGGAPSLNWGKVILHASVVGGVIYLFIHGRKKRWF